MDKDTIIQFENQILALDKALLEFVKQHAIAMDKAQKGNGALPDSDCMGTLKVNARLLAKRLAQFAK